MEYLNLHNKAKNVFVQNMLVINNMPLNEFIHEHLLVLLQKFKY